MNTLTNLINEKFSTSIAVLTALDTAVKASPNDLSIQVFRDSHYKRAVGEMSRDMFIFTSVLTDMLDVPLSKYLSKAPDEQVTFNLFVEIYIETALDTILEGGC